VISIVFMIAALNMVIGFLVAVRLERPVVVPLPAMSWPFGRRAGAATTGSDETAALAVPRDVIVEQIPRRWIEMLDELGLQANSFVEASVLILKLEVNVYRDDLADREELIRRALEKHNKEAVRDAVEEMVALNREWEAKLREAVTLLSDRRGQLDGYEPTADRLENVLLDQVPLLEDCTARLSSVSVDSDEAYEVLINGITETVDLAHDLRDTMQEALAMIMRTEDRLDEFDRQQQYDPLTGQHNRMGIELVFRNWWREDVARMRMVTVALADVDRFVETNKLLGTRVGDRIIGTFGRYLDELRSKESGLDRVFHFGGQRFLFFFGDTGPRSAVKTIDAIRQNVEATKFQCGQAQFALTISAGVSEIRQQEDTVELFRRLTQLVKSAKQAGRNQVCLQEADASQIVAPEVVPVTGRVITIE